MKKADIGVAIYILSAFIMLIVPIPSQLLDVLLACNIAVAFSVMFGCMFAKEVLDLSFFPTVLLFTTVFRISLNVSSTRLILTTGDPGNVVATFGSYVGGNDLIVGAIVFIILIIIQFMVINKGSERVAEVTARFTLDAMPGKQMAIDADLNTGAIDDAEAKRRRDKIQDESSFFGSMDGAVKYVKGDASAGLLITAVNIIGGIAMGVFRQGMEVGAALDKYAVLTIGDGLVSQIPSLLISLSTGILVTKGAKEADFGSVLLSQFFGVPKVLYFVGSVMIALGIMTPLNTLIFIPLGLFFIVVGRMIAGTIETSQIETEIDMDETAAEEIHYMAMNPGYVEEEITGIPTFEPSFHLPAIWITEGQRERAESLGYTVVDPPSIIATHLTEVIRQYIAELLTRQDVQNLINNIKETNPSLVEELVPKLLGIGEIQKVLQNLLREGISVRDLLTIFETLADYSVTTRDTDILTEYVRQSLKRAISGKYFPANESTSVVTLDPQIEQEIMNSVKQTEQGAYLALDPERTKGIIASVGNEIQKLENLGKNPIIITSPIVRMYFKRLTEDYYKDLIVVSYNEIESNIELQSVGMVSV